MDRSSCSVCYAHEKNRVARGLTCAQRTLSLLNLIRRYCDRERNTQCLKMTLATTHFVGLAGPQLQEVARCLGCTYQIERLVILLQDCPVWVVFAYRRVDLEPAREFDEKLNVLSLIQPAGELPLYLRIVDNILIDRFLHLERGQVVD